MHWLLELLAQNSGQVCDEGRCECFRSKAWRLLREDRLTLHPLTHRKPQRGGSKLGSVGPMEKLVIYNGSPRRSGSNSALILGKVTAVLGDRIEVRDLKDTSQWNLWAEAFAQVT